VMTDDAENVWEDASEKVLAMKKALPSIVTHDFSIAFDCGALSVAYREATAMLGDYLDGGSVEFLTFEKRLLEAAIIYGESHGMTAKEIAKLEAEIDV
ncbi:MAG: hypothetical protein HGA51_02425, partial [Demequinaceae bacterium]|nr:hypothetical protein [Demequinaceae bacterium]